MKKLPAYLQQTGYEGKMISVKCLGKLKEKIETWHRYGFFDEAFYEEYLRGFDFQTPDDLPAAKSLIVVAAPQPITRLLFTRKGSPQQVIVPPTYSHETDGLVRNRLETILEPEGYHIARASLPLKMLAVSIGLAEYGKNNIAYIAGMGSFFRLAAFFSDLPKGGHDWRNFRLMERCKGCSACLNSCPTQALSRGRFLLRAERCITYLTETKPDFPPWMQPAWHTCAVGCLSCQTCCPKNREVLGRVEDRGFFSEEETDLILNGAEAKKLPPETFRKLELAGLIEYLEILPRNLRSLFRKSE